MNIRLNHYKMMDIKALHICGYRDGVVINANNYEDIMMIVGNLKLTFSIFNKMMRELRHMELYDTNMY